MPSNSKCTLNGCYFYHCHITIIFISFGWEERALPIQIFLFLQTVSRQEYLLINYNHPPTSHLFAGRIPVVFKYFLFLQVT